MNIRRHCPNFLAVLLLWAFFAQAVTSMVVESPTVDEQAHLMRGYVYLELGDLRFKIGHPILANALNALPLWALTDLSLPTDDPAWLESHWGPFADRFIWQPGTDVGLVFFLSRLVTVAIGMLYAALVFRWARQLWDGQSPPPGEEGCQSSPSGGDDCQSCPPRGDDQSPPPASGGGWGGVIALALFVFDPTILAHSRYTTNDVAVAFFSFAATYALWRYLETERPRTHDQCPRDLVLAGVAFGLAQGSKFSALLLMPAFVAVVGLWPFLSVPWAGSLGRWMADCRRWLLRHAVGLLAIFAIGGLVLWAGYGFDVGSLPGRSLPLPAIGYFEDLIWEIKYFGREGYVFLCDEVSSAGWWYYFLVAFALKSPLPATLAIGTALGCSLSAGCGSSAIGAASEEGRTRRPLQVQNTRARRLMVLSLPALAYFLSTLVSPLNIGYRFFIPVLPYLYVLTGRLATLAKRYQRLLLIGVLVWSGVVALRIHPHYLAYFNEFAGGPDNGWRYLVDSNIDWGQDLPALHDIVERQNLGRIKLSYFGTAHPSYYGLDFEPLPTWEPTPEQGNPFTRTYYPHDPAPGVYAISATHLQGVVMDPDEWDTYAWFRDKSPFAKAGYSIFLYQVEPTGPPVDVALSGLQIDELAPETFAAFGSNDVHLRWFDARTSFVVPSQPGWTVVLGGDGETDEETRFFPKNLVSPSSAQPCTTTAGQTCQLYPPDPAAHAAAVARIEDLSVASQAWRSPVPVPSSEDEISLLPLPVNLSGQLQFLGYEPHPHTLPPSHSLFRVLTAWRVTAPPDGRRAIFVHLLAPDGQVVAQWDGLDVPVEGWREGDILLQAASFELPADLPPDQYWLQTGVYNPKTMERLPVLVDGDSIADRILLSPVEVPAR